MKTLFEIGTLASDEPSVLLFEMGNNFVSLSIVDNSEKAIRAMRVFTFAAVELEECLLEIFKIIDAAEAQFEKVIISPAFPEALLVPRKINHQDGTLLKNAYQLKEVICLSDVVGEWQLVNTYAIDNSLHRQLVQKFPGAIFLHAYTPALKIFNGFANDHQVNVYFVHDQFRVVVKKNKHLQLVQSYTYISPMDVVYYLLKICSEFQLEQEDTHFIISGFIEEDSALYKELHHYFLNLHFANPAFLNLPTGDHPRHYFSSLNSLAACVL